MDVINGVFPSKIINFKTASPSEKRDYEEERRIFYVGMTRAKDKLTVFKYKDAPSIFAGELTKEEKPKTTLKTDLKTNSKTYPKISLKTPTALLKKKVTPVTSGANVPENLVMGQRIY